jgi:predicted aspartyl protease
LEGIKYDGFYQIILGELWEESLKLNKDVTVVDYKMKIYTAEGPRRSSPTMLSKIQRVAKENKDMPRYYKDNLSADDNLILTSSSNRVPFEATIDSNGTTIKL